MAHTPGPWTWTHRNNGRGSESTSLEGPEQKLVIFPTGWHSTSDFHPDNEEANARLIAAAPELLELAQLALGIRQGVRGINGKKYEAELKRVIAKALDTPE